jgi:cyclophilin family peptidyl-prolyl cis-trans isomerase
VAALLGHADPRVRAAGAAAIPALWAGAGPDRSADARALAAALASADAAVAGAAVEAAAAIYRAVATPGAAALAGGASEPAADAAALAVLDAAIVARATSEVDVELAAGLYEAIAARRIAAGLAACQAALAGPAAAAAAARACVIALGRPAPPPRSDPAAAVAPPVDVASVIGHRVRWRLATTRGPIAIDLDPQSAPWAVAAIAALTRRGFYDGLEVHRVVPGFVVQGGDPTQSGWGGPGFSLPAEPGAAAGAAFTAGGVGIADAGRDSGGSQWFIMHASAPHLDGRYTWIGAISAGQAHADALLVGDRVLRATIEIAP